MVGEVEDRKLRKVLERYYERTRPKKYTSVRSMKIARHRLGRLMGNVMALERVNPRLAKGLWGVVEQYRQGKITYPKAKKIIEERLKQAGLEWRD